jgi:hypothetical protein
MFLLGNIMIEWRTAIQLAETAPKFNAKIVETEVEIDTLACIHTWPITFLT